MLAQLVEKGCDAPIHMIYGVNKDDHLVKTDALDAFVDKIPSFTYTTVVVDEASEHLRKGYVTHHMDAEVMHDGDVDVYLCGPPPMVDAVLKYFDAEGIEPQSFHYEKFTPNEAGSTS